MIFLDTVNIMADKYKKKQGSKPKVEDLGLEEGEEIGNENAPYSLQSTNNFSRPLLPPPLPKMPKKVIVIYMKEEHHQLLEIL